MSRHSKPSRHCSEPKFVGNLCAETPYQQPNRAVVLTTPAAQREATLYALLTNRRVGRCVDPAALNCSSASVIVGERGFFDTTTLTALLERAPSAPVLGLIWGEPGPDLRRQVLARSAVRYLSQRPKAGRFTEIYPTESVGSFVSGNWMIAGSDADPKQLRELLMGSSNAAVAVQGHSDGVDAQIRGSRLY